MFEFLLSNTCNILVLNSPHHPFVFKASPISSNVQLFGTRPLDDILGEHATLSPQHTQHENILTISIKPTILLDRHWSRLKPPIMVRAWLCILVMSLPYLMVPLKMSWGQLDGLPQPQLCQPGFKDALLFLHPITSVLIGVSLAIFSAWLSWSIYSANISILTGQIQFGCNGLDKLCQCFEKWMEPSPLTPHYN